MQQGRGQLGPSVMEIPKMYCGIFFLLSLYELVLSGSFRDIMEGWRRPFAYKTLNDCFG